MKSITIISLLLNINFPRHFILFPLHVLPKKILDTHTQLKENVFENLSKFNNIYFPYNKQKVF